MADAPTPSTSRHCLRGKRIPSDSFWAYMFSAIAVDVVLGQWMPGAGTVFVCFCRGMYMLNGYKTDKMLTTTAITAAAGFFPIIEDFATVAFVGFTYMTNVAETNKLGSVAAAVATGKLQDKGKLSAAASGNAPSDAGRPENPHTQNTGHQERGGTGGASRSEGMDKNKPGIDGVRRPDILPNIPRPGSMGDAPQPQAPQRGKRGRRNKLCKRQRAEAARHRRHTRLSRCCVNIKTRTDSERRVSRSGDGVP